MAVTYVIFEAQHWSGVQTDRVQIHSESLEQELSLLSNQT
jgi:hypothetical protein